MTYIKTLFLTIIIETAVLYILGFKNKALYKNVVIANILTNPALNLLLFLTLAYFKEYWLSYVLLCEMIVVVVEWLFLKAVLKEYKLPFFKISFIINAVSFLSGLWINKLLYGVFL